MSLVMSQARIAHGREGPARRSTAEYLTHQAVADLFGEREDRGYLYRTVAEWPGGADVLILSREEPLDPAQLPGRAYGRAVRVQSKSFTPALRAGDLLDFEVRLNATCVVTDRAGRKQRSDVWDAAFAADRDDPRSPHEVYHEYLGRKLDGAAEVVEARVTERGQVRARRGDARHPGSITFVATNLIGTVELTDPTRFLDMVVSGIGRAKAFGCGLLCLSRPGTVLARRRVLEVDAL